MEEREIGQKTKDKSKRKGKTLTESKILTKASGASG
jgi:hypothetical protein